MKKFKVTFKPIRNNVIYVDAETLEQATTRGMKMRVDQIAPRDCHTEEMSQAEIDALARAATPATPV